MAEKPDLSDLWNSDFGIGKKILMTLLYPLTKWWGFIWYGFLIFGAISIFDGGNESSNNTTKSKDCRGKADYEEGYSCGSMTRVMGGSRDPEVFVRQYNYETGRNLLRATDCFKVGFEDGLNGVEK